jgi:1-acyl-sn-glycerol-3-phosphate acyltransferase
LSKKKLIDVLYYIIKPIIRIGLFFFFRKLYFNTKQYWGRKGPLLLAVNHPNSFLDAIVVGAFFKEPVYFLARGDAFKNKWALRILTALKCKPVYRLREGKNYLHLNDTTFEACRSIFQQNGIVLIFTEGLCENEWEIRPLKKGTARLAISYWKQFADGDKLQVLPVSLNYSSFYSMPKTCWINFGHCITAKEFDLTKTDGELYASFNRIIMQQWAQATIVLPTKEENEKRKLVQYLTVVDLPYHQLDFSQKPIKHAVWPKWLYYTLSLPSYILVYPWFKFWQRQILKRTRNSGHYDSVLFGVLTLFFVLYTLVLCTFVFTLYPSFALLIMLFCLLYSSTLILTKFRLSCNTD